MVFFLPALILIFSVLAMRSAGKTIFDITNLESSGTLNLSSVSQWSASAVYLLIFTLFLMLLLLTAGVCVCVCVCVCVDSQKKLVTWLRILLRNTWLVEYYYQPWSYVVKTGKLQLMALTLSHSHFCLIAFFLSC